jgi:hypothetical protein
MTAIPSIDLPAWMVEQLSQASPDLLRQMVQTFAEALMSADADATSRVRSTVQRCGGRRGGVFLARQPASTAPSKRDSRSSA